MDPQNPVRFAPDSDFVVSYDSKSLAYGLRPTMPDGPAARNLGAFLPVPPQVLQPPVTSPSGVVLMGGPLP